MAREDWGEKIDGGYFDEENHIYRCEKGIIRPGTTQVFSINGMNDFSMMNQEDVEWKKNYGTQVHKATELMVNGDLDWLSLDEDVEAPLVGIEKRLREMQFNMVASEERRVVTVNGMSYGMTLDLRGTAVHLGREINIVIDLKTGTKYSKTWDWQIGGYLIPQNGGVWMGVALQIGRDGKVIPHYVTNILAAKREFQVLLAAAILKANNGFARIGG